MIAGWIHGIGDNDGRVVFNRFVGELDVGRLDVGSSVGVDLFWYDIGSCCCAGKCGQLIGGVRHIDGGTGFGVDYRWFGFIF